MPGFRTVRVIQQVVGGDGTRNVIFDDSMDVSDELAGTIGPVQTQDSMAIDDSLKSSLGNFQESLASDDAATLDLSTAQADSLDATDALAGTLGPIQTQETAQLSDLIDVGPLVVLESLDSDDAVGLATFQVIANDTIESNDSSFVILLTSVEEDTAMVSDAVSFGPLEANDSLSVSDARGEASITGTHWPNTVVSSSNFDNTANAIDLSTATGASSTIAQSGGLGGSSQNETGSIVVSTADVNITPPPSIDSCVLEWGWTTADSGNALQSGQAVNYAIEYSVNDGGSWILLETVTAVASSGNGSFDITGITYSQYNQIRFRCTGTVTSGTIAVVGGATQSFTFRYGRKQASFTQTL